MLCSKGFTKWDERCIILSVGWCETKPAQLKNPGRYSSFPFPHLSPLGAPRVLPFLAFSGQHSANSGLVPSSVRRRVQEENAASGELAGSRKSTAESLWLTARKLLAPPPGSGSRACA